MKKVTCVQTHSNNVCIVTKENIDQKFENCDGLITNLRNVELSIKTADCVPITLKDEIKKVIGVVHAGWRGTEKEIIKNAVNLMISNFNSDPKDIKVEIGPAIDKDNYLVRDGVYDLFSNDYSDFFEKVDDSQWKFDLVGVNIKQIISLGVLDKNIINSNISTYLNKNYPSYRRDGKSEGFETKVVL